MTVACRESMVVGVYVVVTGVLVMVTGVYVFVTGVVVRGVDGV